MFLICGEALYDLFLDGDTLDRPLKFDAHPGGSPFNVAVGMARLGAHAALFTGVSDDILGTRLASILHAEGVGTDYLVHSGRRTTLSVVGVDSAGNPSYAFYGVGSADCSLTPADLPLLGEAVTGLHFGSYSIAVSPVADAFARLAEREAHRFISLDPNVRLAVEPDIALWRRRVTHMRRLSNLVKTSVEDIQALHPAEDPEVVIKRWAMDGPSMVVMTRGASEIVAYRGAQEFRLTPPEIEPVDTVGAGDSFQSALLSSLSTQSDPARYLETLPRDAVLHLLRRSALAAAITCERRGADPPRSSDLQDRNTHDIRAQS